MEKQALEKITDFFFERGIFSEDVIFKFLYQVFPNEEKLEELEKYGDNRYKIMYYGDIEEYEKESKEVFNYDEMTEKQFLIGRKYFKPEFAKFYPRINDLGSFCERVHDRFLVNEIFETITSEKDLSAFADVFGVRPLKDKIHKLSDINFVFDNYYHGQKIPDIDYFYLLSHPKSNLFFERIVASIDPDDVDELIYEKLLHIATTIFIDKLVIPEETRKLICEKDPRITIERIFVSNRNDFVKVSLTEYPFAKRLILKNIDLFGAKHFENYSQIVSIENFTYTDEQRFINYMEDLSKDLIEFLEDLMNGADQN